MEENNKDDQNLLPLIKEYVSTQFEVLRLSTIERLTVVLANLLTSAFVVGSIVLTFLFGSVALALYMGEELGSYAKGFGLITLLYLMLGLIMYFIKDKYVEKGLINFMIKRIFRNNK
jgi:hypothetical protein